MIQILDASYSEGNYSATIQIVINNELIKLKFGILEIDFGHIKRIVQFRPFENTGVAPYSYFFIPSYSKVGKDLAEMNVKVEQLDKHKQFEFRISQKCLSNLIWLDQIKDKSEVKHLVI